MPYSDPSKILKSKQLKTTKGRLAVLELFLSRSKALSHTDIESHFELHSIDIDRVTIYRILDCFVKHELIHKVSTEQAIQLFALTTEHEKATPHHEHAHFICDSCEAIECIDLPETLPSKLALKQNGYAISSVDITLHGTCQHCNTHQLH